MAGGFLIIFYWAKQKMRFIKVICELKRTNSSFLNE